MAKLPPEGADAYQAYKGTGSAIAAFIELAEEAGAEIVLPVAASAWPSGPVEDSAFEYIAGRICAAVADGCDAVLLDLHGAMVTQHPRRRRRRTAAPHLRAIAPQVPIGVALDMHTNLLPGHRRARHRDRRLPDLPARRHVTTPACAPAARSSRMLAGRARRPWPGATSRCCRT
jgi:microcystin degradation protein MlrC